MQLRLKDSRKLCSIHKLDLAPQSEIRRCWFVLPMWAPNCSWFPFLSFSSPLNPTLITNFGQSQPTERIHKVQCTRSRVEQLLEPCSLLGSMLVSTLRQQSKLPSFLRRPWKWHTSLDPDSRDPSREPRAQSPEPEPEPKSQGERQLQEPSGLGTEY